MFLLRVRLWCYSAFAAGIGFSVIAISSSAYSLIFGIHSAVANGTVVSVDRDSEGLNCPKFQFMAENGAMYVAPCHVWTDEHFAVNDIVLVRYKRNDPNSAWRESLLQILPRETALWGAGALCLGFALRWYARKRRISLKLWG